MRRTKIIATIGPASIKKEVLEQLIKGGVNICRLNFSHGDYQWHKQAIKKIRSIAKKHRKNIAIMTDIQGARIRVLNKKSLFLKKGEKVYITDADSPHNSRCKKELVLDWDDFYLHIKRGDQIFIDDGLVNLKVVRKAREGCVAQVLEGGKIIKGKGVNIPAISPYLGFLTEKDLKDLDFILEQNVDFLCASFVSKASDIESLKKIIGSHFEKTLQQKKIKLKNKHLAPKSNKKLLPCIVAKIERKEAIRNLEKIVQAADAVMVARGDLAIEMPQAEMGVLQKDIVKQCIKYRKPVIVATQMAASMMAKPRPTRAEISDITNAVVDGADAVLFSNETTMGKYPEKVIETAVEIIEATEKSPYNDVKLKKNNKFARMLFSRKRKRKRTQTVTVKDIENCLAISSLRQEDIIVKFKPACKETKRKAAVIWSVK